MTKNKTVKALIFAAMLGGLNALRGSGLIKKYLGTSTPFKWGIMPILMGCGAVFVFGGEWWLALIFPVPYLWKMGTGTGGDMQARADNNQLATFNPHEMRPFDNIAAWVADMFTKDENLRLAKWHQIWGAVYCTLSAFVYTLPFIATNYLYALPLFSYPLMVRYISWRGVEFCFIALFTLLFSLSI